MFFPLVLSGLAAAFIMSCFLWAAHRSQLADGDMHRALGSLMTRSEKNSLPVGLILHAMAGIVFAMIYRLVVMASPVNPDSNAVIFLCLGISIFHGLLVGMFMSIVIAEHHPLARFRKSGFDVVITHLLAHIVFGLSLGLFFYWWVPAVS